MLSFLEFLAEDNEYYHVTSTKNVAGIRKKGLLGLQSSNWIQAGSKKRYGGGNIFAFDNETDAHRWAAKMDWDHNQHIGSGKISVVKMKTSVKFNVDTADPLGQSANKGKWLKTNHHIPSNHIHDSYPFTSEHAKKLVQDNKK